eukprot:4146473-Prymnesium_polylepis.1
MDSRSSTTVAFSSGTAHEVTLGSLLSSQYQSSSSSPTPSTPFRHFEHRQHCTHVTSFGSLVAVSPRAVCFTAGRRRSSAFGSFCSRHSANRAGSRMLSSSSHVSSSAV